MFRSQDHRWMSLALNVAEEGRLEAHPNPLVGAVVVRGGRCVATGAHERFGGPHAEVNALRRAGKRARGADLYVTLEPCSRWGKTPPCTDAVIAAGVRRVVVAALDPTLRRGGVHQLRRAGLSVVSGLLADAAQKQNAAFFKRVTQRLPYVVLKLAQTLDGKIASRTGRSRWITGPEARRLGHRLRAQSDAVLVGAGTVRQDDPTLTSHGQGPDPLRVVVSASLRLPRNGKIFKKGAPTWVLTAPSAPPSRCRALAAAGAEVVPVPHRRGRVAWRAALTSLAEKGVGRLLVEGGGDTAAGLLEAGLVDEAYVFVSPQFLGGAAVPSVAGTGWEAPGRGPRLRDVGVSRLGPDLLIHGWL